MRENNSDNINSFFIKAASWFAISSLTIQGFSFVKLMILARLLLPEDFGLIAVVSIFVNFAIYINDPTWSNALIQRAEITKDHLNTTFWSNLIIGVLFVIIIFLTSTFISHFFNNYSIKYPLIISSLVLIIRPFGIINESMIMKELRIKEYAIAELTGRFVAGIIAIILAYKGFGVWSLVIESLVDRLIFTIVTNFSYHWHPTLLFKFNRFKELFSYGSHIMGYNISNYLNDNIDYFMIGKFLNTSTLGIYTLAYNLSEFPRNNISSIFTRTAFPLYSSIQNNNELIKNNYLSSVTYLSLLTFPILTGSIIIAPDFIILLFGSNWSPSILPFQILCIGALFSSITTFNGPILKSKGRPDLLFKLSLLRLFLTAGALIIGIQYGVIGVCIAISCVVILIFFISQFITNTIIDLGMKNYSLSLTPAFLGSVTMLSALFIYRAILASSLNVNSGLFRLVSTIIIGGLIYLIFIRYAKPDVYTEVCTFVRNKLCRS